MAYVAASIQAREGCGMVKRAAAFLGFSAREISEICDTAKAVTGFDHRRRVRYIKYSSAARCPLLAAVIAAGGEHPAPVEIIETGVYTVGMAAAALDMSRAVVRRLVRSGEIPGYIDRGGYLIGGAALRRFAGSGVVVLGAGRRGAIRPRRAGAGV